MSPCTVGMRSPVVVGAIMAFITTTTPSKYRRRQDQAHGNRPSRRCSRAKPAQLSSSLHRDDGVLATAKRVACSAARAIAHKCTRCRHHLDPWLSRPCPRWRRLHTGRGSSASASGGATHHGSKRRERGAWHALLLPAAQRLASGNLPLILPATLTIVWSLLRARSATVYINERFQTGVRASGLWSWLQSAIVLPAFTFHQPRELHAVQSHRAGTGHRRSLPDSSEEPRGDRKPRMSISAPCRFPMSAINPAGQSDGKNA